MAMSDAAERPVLAPSATELAFAWFLRLVAVYCLAFGIVYWVRLVGFYEGALWRFDLMPVYWQIAAVALAVFFPFAGIGLWMLASWGPVIWFICAAGETVMHAALPHLFGQRLAVIAVHGSVALIYAVFRLVLYIQKRRSRAP